MFEELKTEAATTASPYARIGVLVAALLVLGAAIFGTALLSGKRGPEQLPGAKSPEGEEVPEEPRIDVARLPAKDDTATHQRYDEDAVQYLRAAADRDLSDEATRTTVEAVSALPYAEALGQVFEVEGRIEALVNESYRGPRERLWSVLVEGADGGRVIFVKHALGSDAAEGRPDDAFSTATDYLRVGDRLLARGVYMQRRTGTLGEAILREPVPVLVAAPPSAAFRKLPRPAVPIADLTEADWDDVEDRFLSQTQKWEEAALFQVTQWAREVGHAEILSRIRSGEWKVEEWGKDLFDRWGAEIESEDGSSPRPLTESLRGRMFKTNGLLGSFQKESWESMPRVGSAWGVDTLYLLDLVSDYWGNNTVRSWSVFPIETYEGLKRTKWEHVAVYGFFLKNHTYKTQFRRDGTAADLTMPMFIIVHVEPAPVHTLPYGTIMWVISGMLVGLAVLSYFFLTRGARREEQRLRERRLEHRRKNRPNFVSGDASEDAPEDAPDE